MKRYPLEAVRQIRHQRVDERATELGKQRRVVEQAARAVLQAHANLENEKEQTRQVVSSEFERLSEGACRVEDLVQAASFKVGAVQREKGLADVEAQAKGKERTEKQSEEKIRALLAQQEAEAKAVDRHREKWRDEIKRAQEQAEEEQTLDGWTARWVTSQQRG